MNHPFTSWSVKTSKLLSAVLRHRSSVTLGKYLEASIEDLHTKTKLRCDTVHGKVDASKIRQQEELTEILQRARTNPWHLFKSGLLQRVDASGNKMETTRLWTTPSHRLPASLKDALGGEYNWASWLQHPLLGFGVHFFLKAFELGKLTGNYLVEFNQKPKVYTNGYLSPWEKHRQRFPGGVALMLDDLGTSVLRPI